MENRSEHILENLAEVHGGSLSNPANRIRGEDRGGRLAGVYNAGMDLRLSGGRRQICGFMKKMGLTGVKCWDLYILSGWTHGFALQINIHRDLIPPSVK